MSSRIIRAAFVVASIVLAPGVGGASASSLQTATVERIVDGDTLVLRGGKRVRLVQIDAPESGEECYAAASARELSRLAPPGARVLLEAEAHLDVVDRYGRLLRYLHAGTTNVNLALVRRGAATPWFYGGERGRYADRLLAATTFARSQRRGMWGACRVFWSPDGPVQTRPK